MLLFNITDIYPHADTFKEAVANWKKLPDAERKAYTENFKVRSLCCTLAPCASKWCILATHAVNTAACHAPPYLGDPRVEELS